MQRSGYNGNSEFKLYFIALTIEAIRARTRIETQSQQEVAMSEFFKVANTSDLPAGRALVVEVGGRTIALFNVNGEFFALDNTCMHRGGPLGEGFVDQINLTVQCPWHGWIYSLTTGASPIDPMAKVEKFDVRVEGEEVRITLD